MSLDQLLSLKVAAGGVEGALGRRRESPRQMAAQSSSSDINHLLHNRRLCWNKITYFFSETAELVFCSEICQDVLSCFSYFKNKIMFDSVGCRAVCINADFSLCHV